MFPQCHVPVFLTVLSLLALVRCVTVYGPTGAIGLTASTTSSGTSASATPTGVDSAPAYNQVVLQAPPVPQPPPPTQFSLQLLNNAQGVVNLSIPQNGAFYGFSIEMSVVDQVIGVNSTFINVEFLNLMAILQERGDRINVRVGGNTQDTASVVSSLPGGKAMVKQNTNGTDTTQTPILTITPEFIYMLNNVSSLVNTKWYLGIPMNDTSNLRLQIAEVGEAILGDNLIGLQVGNEPDLYAGHQHRPPTYDPQDYADEFGIVVQAISQDSLIPVRNNLIGPSVASGPWSPEDVWNTGFIPTYSDVLGALAVEHYPDNNCAEVFPDGGFGTPKNPQDVFPDYLNHTSGVDMVAMYLNSTTIAQQAGKPFLMFETNTASCGGFPGVSDSFGAALWALDYGLQMAYANFSGALLHVGGEDDTYNPFTPPPTNQTSFHQWTIGPVFYSAIAVAETFGKSNNTQVVDLQANDGNIYTPGYAIYDNGVLDKLALFNYVTDPSGASTYTATISLADGGMPSTIYVKYLVAPSVAEKFNITWAGQTLGGQFESDGRLKGTENIVSVPCDQSQQSTCSITVPAPGFALVFLSSAALSSSEPQSTMTFSTSVLTETINTVVVPPSALATAQGMSGVDRQHLGSTSKGSSGAARTAGSALSLSRTSLFATVLLGVYLGRTL